VEGVGEPLVTDMEDVDYPCYLSAAAAGDAGAGGGGECDILFPTDFDRLADYIDRVLLRSDTSTSTPAQVQNGANEEPVDTAPWTVAVSKQRGFLEEYGGEEVKATESWWTGYNPMLEDFGNCSVLTVSRRGGKVEVGV